MAKKEKITDTAVLSFLSVVSLITIYRHFVYGYTLPLSTYLGIFLLSILFLFKIVSGWKGKYLVFILLFLGVLGVVNFTVETAAIGYVGVGMIGLNPFVFLLLVIYSVVCNEVVLVFRRINRGSENEISGERDKMELFYYSKFIKLGSAEFNDLFKYYDDYPEEAKYAVDSIKKERES